MPIPKVRWQRHFASSMLAFQLLAVPVTQAQQSANKEPDAQSKLDALLFSVGRNDSPGCFVDIRRRHEVLVRRGYGMANLEVSQPIDENTIFEAGSVAKQFAGAVVAALVADGKLSFQDSVRRWIPELPELYQSITIAMLLHHTSGIRDWGVLADLTGWPRGTRVYGMKDELAMLSHQRMLNFTPGSEYLYSNSNFLLAAIVAERVSGKSFAALSQELLFQPLGMTHTGWRTDFRAVVPGRAQAYSKEDGAWMLDMPFEDVVGPGGLLTTTGDLQKWNSALAAPTGGRARWIDVMVVPAMLNDGTKVPYGIGLELGPVNGHPSISHAGSTAGYRSWLGRFPEDGLSVALLCNAGTLNTEELGPQVAAIFLPEASAASTQAPGSAVDHDLAGLYRNAATDAAVTLSETNGRLRIGGAVFGAESQNRLVANDGRHATVRRKSDGSVMSIDVERTGNTPTHLERAVAWTPSADDLRAIEGDYRSDELEVTSHLRASKAGLIWVDDRGVSQPLIPIYADTFRAPESGWVLHVLRDKASRVVSFNATIARARRVSFTRAGGLQARRP